MQSTDCRTRSPGSTKHKHRLKPEGLRLSTDGHILIRVQDEQGLGLEQNRSNAHGSIVLTKSLAGSQKGVHPEQQGEKTGISSSERL